MKVVIVESAGTELLFMEDHRFIAYVPLHSVRHCIWQLSRALIGVIRSVSHGYAVPEQHIEFAHRRSESLWLRYDIPVGADAVVELHDLKTPSKTGGYDPQSPLIHTATMSPREFADLLYHMLCTLSRSQVADMLETDPSLFGVLGEAVQIYQTEVNRMQNAKRQPDAPALASVR